MARGQSDSRRMHPPSICRLVSLWFRCAGSLLVLAVLSSCSAAAAAAAAAAAVH